MDTPLDSIALIGYTCGLGAGNCLCEQGPIRMQASPYIKNRSYQWQGMLKPKDNQKKIGALDSIVDITTRLAEITYALSKKKQFFVTIGGDHSCAIGTWSGASAGIFPKKLALLWIDAHLDSHTPQTTPSGNIHGMPLAALLGHGEKSLTQVLTDSPKLLPENVCVLGVRSFEKEEYQLLAHLNVRVYYMDEIKQRGFESVFSEGMAAITQHSDYFGVSLDLDVISPMQAPGVGTPEPDGLDTQSLLRSIETIVEDSRFIGAEIAEFNPSLDIEHKTEKIIAQVLGQFSNGVMKRLGNESK